MIKTIYYIFMLFIIIGLSGCAGWVKIKKTDDGIVFKSNKSFDASYKDEEVDASASTKGKGLFENMISPAMQRIEKP